MCSHSIRLRYKYLKWLEMYANIGACDVWVSAIDLNVCLEWLIFILWISQKEKKAIMIHVFEQEWSLLNMQKWARSREIWQIINWMHDLLHVHRQMKVLYLGCTLVVEWTVCMENLNRKMLTYTTNSYGRAMIQWRKLCANKWNTILETFQFAIDESLFVQHTS